MFIFDLLVAGGVVMIPLLGFSILAIALILERLLFWYRVNRRQKRLVRDALAAYQNSPEMALAKLKQGADLPIARIFLEAVEMDRVSPNAFRLALESATQAELPTLRRFNTVFDIIISAAPLLGLLGTILGLIRSFGSLQLGDVGSESAIAVTGGISEALISTAAGLTVAIFTLIFANIFRGFYRRQLAQIQEYGGQLELLHLCRYEGHPDTLPIAVGD
ncbi:MotA/TolQ/ExbB proton channel family protein [Thermocoleostomius sinensis]|jgi:biopolymer transport protein ExbB|uniref:MotA/TolQ/ExbB proton channel family protein n=1 Tax=Thermocoleostomius sinensis A174 TaxID=2016057 RepID=A0A9E8Z7T3_9CYAN|nr:MotA/TolQ/ExbB proton channel family protein [Thermocoleostomius sinensis]WAL58045.1 MotA/TolQ/ExbB proton channel family protein [Thermocoleostomius sinensis A174]